MENIFKIIYDKTKNKSVLSQKDLEKILNLTIVDKRLNEFVNSVDFQSLRSNGLASYSIDTRRITIYLDTIEKLKSNIEHKLLINDDFERFFYINLLILQIILHEVEHANQQKKLKSIKDLETLIIKLSYTVKYNNIKALYEYSPEERFAEINSVNETALLLNYLSNKSLNLMELFELEKLKRYLRGYHYRNSIIKSPTIEYFSKGQMQNALKFIDVDNYNDLNERLFFGFPIEINEYCSCMENIIYKTNKYFSHNLIIK